ncbi:unnamed protein product [Prorocentrum cordatum]|uniref:Uncharacterized protein n=1 Tax=Prorocentrum cordatum TaxID=2364126 RepID=A0ABN9SYN4_9DINO|nr:unnamed protein product [Polarella glacialis]
MPPRQSCKRGGSVRVSPAWRRRAAPALPAIGRTEGRGGSRRATLGELRGAGESFAARRRLQPKGDGTAERACGGAGGNWDGGGPRSAAEVPRAAAGLLEVDGTSRQAHDFQWG